MSYSVEAQQLSGLAQCSTLKGLVQHSLGTMANTQIHGRGIVNEGLCSFSFFGIVVVFESS